MRAILLALTVCSAVIAFSAASAQAVVTTVGSTTVGLQPRTSTIGSTLAERKTFSNNSGNVVLHGTGDYAIYWDPYDELHQEWLTNIDTFFHQLGEVGTSEPLGTIFAALTQYRDRGNTPTPFSAQYKGAYSDTSKFPAAGCTDPNPLAVGQEICLTDAQLREQLQSFITTHDLPTGMSTVYFLITPPGVTVCLDTAATHCSDYKLSEEEEEQGKRNSASYKNSFCSYHGDINPDSAAEGDTKTILYAAIPWSAGYEGEDFEYVPFAPANPTAYNQAYDCQDGGWSAEKGEENLEHAKELSKEEKKALEEDTAEVKAEIDKARALEGPHIEEPNQAGKGEWGDYAQAMTDVLVNQISEQEANIVTDPLMTSWHSTGGREATDMCRNFFASTAGPTGGAVEGGATANTETEAGDLSNTTVGAHRYYVNNVFNLSTHGCVGGVALIPRIVVPDRINAGEIAGFDGMESSVSMIAGEAFGPSGPPQKTYATFSWNFGDGTPEVTGFAPGAPTCESPWLSPCAGSAFHSYQYGGTYNVTLRITDVGGDTTAFTEQVSVTGPAAPSASSTSSSSSSSSSTTSTTGTGTALATGVPAPVAADAVLSHSLRTLASNGVVVRYSVNEQVAGKCQVLMSAALAHRLGISGTLAKGLPAGTPPELLIAQAIVVTTTGGHNSVKLLLSKRTARRLATQRKVTFMLRLMVRNANAHEPLTSTVLSDFTLYH